jgi:multidrug resistance efflux pump
VIELILGTYGFLCWLVFKKFRLVPMNGYTIGTAVLGGVAILLFIFVVVQMFHPAAGDARLYAYTTPVVPQVKGMVVEVPVVPNAPLRKGDILFRLEPAPYRFEVDRLEAMLAAANTSVAQLEKQLRAAEASRSGAEADLQAAESDLDRQARETVEQAKNDVARARSSQELAAIQKERAEELITADAISQDELDRVRNAFDTADAALRQAESQQRKAEESLRSSGPRLQSVRDQLRAAQAAEDSARLAFESETGGQNPQVRQIAADLSRARWELEQTTVRAPADGYVTQVLLRPGQMATSLPLAPVMVFVHAEAQVLVASFKQNVLANLEVGNEAEMIIDAYPGEVFPVRLQQISPAIAEGQVLASGQLRSTASGAAASRIPVTFTYGDEIAALGLPVGAAGTIAVYTDHWKPFAIMRKIILRIKSWENYLFLP